MCTPVIIIISEAFRACVARMRRSSRDISSIYTGMCMYIYIYIYIDIHTQVYEYVYIYKSSEALLFNKVGETIDRYISMNHRLLMSVRKAARPVIKHMLYYPEGDVYIYVYIHIYIYI